MDPHLKDKPRTEDEKAMGEGETIYALSTARGRAAVALVRVSGPKARAVAEALTGRPPPVPRRAVLRSLRDGEGRPLDRALMLFFAGPASFTGEDMLELHLHGGRAVVEGVLEALAALPGLAPAEPGAFTRRAFEAGKLDLTAAEGLNDLVMAETAAQREQALRQLGGALAALYEGWRERLLEALARLDAEIDFPDEDLPEDATAAVAADLAALRGEMAAHLDDARRGERLRAGASVVILGAPNVGKSSLLNTLARRDAAIVSDIAGTTRDLVEVTLDLAGYPVTLVDTAGLREAGDSIEAEGVRRALARAEAADLRLLLVEAAAWPVIPPGLEVVRDDSAILLLTKCDLLSKPAGEGVLALSVRSGEGVDELLALLEERVVALCDVREAPAITRARHRRALLECSEALDRFAGQADPVLAAEDARLAVRALGRITGRVDVEDVLDRLFANFCIGK